MMPFILSSNGLFGGIQHNRWLGMAFLGFQLKCWLHMTFFELSTQLSFRKKMIRISSWLKQYLGDLNRFSSWLKRLSGNWLRIKSWLKWIHRCWFRSTHYSKCFLIFRFKSTHDSSKNNWFWVDSWFDSELYPYLLIGIFNLIEVITK